MNHRWHVPTEQINDYLADRVDQVSASSIEAHLVNCAHCRKLLAELSDAEVDTRSWATIERRIDNELNSRVERVARRLGLPDREIRTLAPTVSLQFGWLIATFLALLCAAALARQGTGPDEMLARTAFLTLAPLAPLAAVVAALSAVSEPAPEVARVTSASRLRIGALRASTVMFAAIAMGLIASAVLPSDWLDAVVWLLPALALSGLGALLAGRAAPTPLIAGLGSGWVVVVAVAARLSHDRLAAFRPGAQALYLTVAVIALLIIALRRDSLDFRSTT